ncbi:hypothetical protein CVT25_001665 [Psilocybe cyanescens]|uniref:MARVEL domain-containing protein n=1 Tax=Psilocybe cyanescens TaxID=93625 RepID=A0A409XHK5_PSICY|nr:hypothetical protein CVT25_001665 [Psilocybe cyanescens]
MIVVTPDMDSSDAASTNNTLVHEKFQRVPRYLPTLVYSSFLVSTLAFSFVIVDYVSSSWPDLPNSIVPAVLAYLCTLPHHSAVLLLQWLERHQTESILPFSPSSLRAIVYSLVSLVLWIASTAVSAINLHRNSASYWTCENFTVFNTTATPSYRCVSYDLVQPPVINYWSSLASTLTTSLEVILALSITSICYIHHRRRNKAAQPEIAPSITSTPSESKVLSA